MSTRQEFILLEPDKLQRRLEQATIMDARQAMREHRDHGDAITARQFDKESMLLAHRGVLNAFSFDKEVVYHAIPM
jgi:hypothetical protein